LRSKIQATEGVAIQKYLFSQFMLSNCFKERQMFFVNTFRVSKKVQFFRGFKKSN